MSEKSKTSGDKHEKRGAFLHGIDPDHAKHISTELISARRSGQALTGFPGELPDSVEAAFHVQSVSINTWSDEVAGWKVGGIPPHFQKQFGVNQLCGPVFRRAVHMAKSSVHTMPVFEGGFSAVEGEIIIKTAHDIKPGDFDPGVDHITDIVESFHVGVEIASSPIPDLNNIGPTCVICDFGNNYGLIVGKPIPNWKDLDLSDIPVNVVIDGKEVGKGNAGDMPGGPLHSLAYLVETCAQRKMTLPAGSYITTGAITGVHEAPTGSLATVSFGPYGSIDIELVKATPDNCY